MRKLIKYLTGWTPEKRLLTMEEISQMLRVHPNSVRRWAEEGQLKCYRVGIRGDQRFKIGDVDRFLDTRSTDY